MEASSTIKKVFSGNKIFVPTYQRAYSWDTEFDKTKPGKQVNVFLSDLEDYNKSLTKSKYYFGHFLFEEKSDNLYGVIDGQQRLTTITIFIATTRWNIPYYGEENFIRKEAKSRSDYFLNGTSSVSSC